MLSMTKEELKSHQDAKYSCICEKITLKKLSKKINCWKGRDHIHYIGKDRGALHSICNLDFNMPNEIPVFFCNISNNDYHFIIKELATSLNVLEKIEHNLKKLRQRAWKIWMSWGKYRKVQKSFPFQ